MKSVNPYNNNQSEPTTLLHFVNPIEPAKPPPTFHDATFSRFVNPINPLKPINPISIRIAITIAVIIGLAAVALFLAIPTNAAPLAPTVIDLPHPIYEQCQVHHINSTVKASALLPARPVRD